MTFDEWWGSLSTREQASYYRDEAKRAWDAAILSEREACAKICEGYPLSSYADAIRARSNTK